MTIGGPDAWAIFLDFDGTLVDIAERPDAVIVDPGLPVLLRKLRVACGGALAIVTGRAVDVIDAFLPALDLDVCGLHGLERRLSGRTLRTAPPNHKAFRSTLRDTLDELPTMPGIIVEDKGESVAFHWRGAPAAAALLAQTAVRLASAVDGYRVQRGKAVAEVVPALAGKGSAIAALLADPPYRGRRPFFVGDDVTDENGFVVVNQLGGVTMKIGAGDTTATRHIATPALLRDVLSRFASGQPIIDWL